MVASLIFGIGLWAGLSEVVQAIPLSLTPDRYYLVPQDSPAQKKFRNGVEALIRNDLKTAESAFREAARLDPRLAAPLLGLADVAVKQRNFQEAEKWLKQASSIEPNSDQVQVGWARYYRIQNNPGAAEKALRKALELKQSAPAYLELGDLYLANPTKRRDAQAFFEKAAALAPDNPFARYSLAVALAANGQVDRAMQEFERVSQIIPDDPEPWRSIGRLHAERKQYDKAISAFDRGLKIQPGNVLLLEDRGDIAVTTGDLTGAGRYYGEAVKLMPSLAPVQVKLGWVYQLEKHWADAEQAYLAALKINPNLPTLNNNLALLYSETKKDPIKALSWAKKAVELNPEIAAFQDTLGWVLRSQGKLAEAEIILLKASEMKPESAEAYFHLGQVYLDQNKKKEAETAFRKALVIQKNYAPAHQALQGMGISL